ncbi:MAG TPA: Nramp family divalent metal transporter [Xanthomonadaceae bacterium]|nr:Nramp family divalent metal transporter [Xanthomonadaceae bacterium]
MGGHLSRRHRQRAEPAPEPVSARGLLRQLGPGFITGASDDDPSGIATYSQVGAQFGYALLWTMPFSWPLMTAIQDISARIGRITGHGIAGNLRRFYPHWLARFVVALMVAANVFNIGADFSAMGEALKLLAGGPALAHAIGFALLSLVLQVFVPYHRYARLLKWLTFALFAYVAVVFAVEVQWRQALLGAVVPKLAFTPEYLTAAIAVLGTTISPYLFFWQASEEAEDTTDDPHDRPLKRAPWQARRHLRRIDLDTAVGMAFSNLVSFFIILTCAATLHASGVTGIASAAQAAEALRPIAGGFTFWIFSAGIIGTGLLAVPVLAGSAAYAVGELMQWHVSLESRPREAKGFYLVLAGAMLTGLALDFIGIDPIRALFWSAVLNGVVAAPAMVMIMLLAGNRRVVAGFRLPPALRIAGWAATVVMLATTVGLLASWMA